MSHLLRWFLVIYPLKMVDLWWFNVIHVLKMAIFLFASKINLKFAMPRREMCFSILSSIESRIPPSAEPGLVNHEFIFFLMAESLVHRACFGELQIMILQIGREKPPTLSKSRLGNVFKKTINRKEDFLFSCLSTSYFSQNPSIISES